MKKKTVKKNSKKTYIFINEIFNLKLTNSRDSKPKNHIVYNLDNLRCCEKAKSIIEEIEMIKDKKIEQERINQENFNKYFIKY